MMAHQIQAAMLPDGRRLHLQHGPIDLVIEAFGDPSEVRFAYGQATHAFEDVLATLVRELAILKSPLKHPAPAVTGPVAKRMVAACWPYRQSFITPMAAVAGAVADHVLARMIDGRSLARAYVNDGGDIAFHLAPGAMLACGLASDLTAPAIDGMLELTSDLAARGLATSGWRGKGQGGRSFSFGIADSVTVLAHDGAAADAAASVIANAVDLPGHRAIARRPASDIEPDSDLGQRLVTVDVEPLLETDVRAALARGVAEADRLRAAGLICGAVLVLQRRYAWIGAGLARLAAA
jgi:ApbE superfamily uncharacterized protein (UPF0280 family)